MTGHKFHRLHWIHLSNRRHEAHEVLEIYRHQVKTLRQAMPINPMSVTELARMPSSEWFSIRKMFGPPIPWRNEHEFSSSRRAMEWCKDLKAKEKKDV